jgi:hypothetical protein
MIKSMSISVKALPQFMVPYAKRICVLTSLALVCVSLFSVGYRLPELLSLSQYAVLNDVLSTHACQLKFWFPLSTGYLPISAACCLA